MNKDKLIELISNAWDDGNGNSYPSQTREDTDIGLQNFLDSCEKEIKELSEPNAGINTTDANLNIGCVSNCNYKEKYEKCIKIIKRFDAGIIGMYDL